MIETDIYLPVKNRPIKLFYYIKCTKMLPTEEIGMEDYSMSENEDFDELEIEEEEEEIVETQMRTKVPSGTHITLFFRSTIGPGEKLEKLTVDPEMGVSELKETLGGIFGLDPQDFHISISGRTLDRDDVLSNYDIENGLECLIIPVSTAG
ncbi:MAG: ubiquitin-like domain-containing protein [Promethearchaeota archaeon]